MNSLLNTLPSKWPLVPIGAICQVGTGNGAPQGDEYFAGGTHLFVRMQDVGRCQSPYITTTVDRLNDVALEKHSLRQWPANSLLIPKSGASVALNKRALLREPAYVVSHLAVLVPGGLIDPEYLYHLSCTLDMMRLALDPAYPSLRTSDLARIRIPLPPLSEQQQIVEILQEAEEIRRLRAEAEAKTAELIPAIYYKTFLSSNQRSSWEKSSVAGIAADQDNSIRTGPFGSDLLHSEFVDAGIPVLGIDNAVANRFRWSERRYIDLNKFSDLERFRVYPGDVMITIMGTVGRVAIAPPDLPEAISTKHLCVITPNKEKILPSFLWATLLYDPSVRAQTKAVGKGAIMEGWNSKIIRSLKFPLPPLSLQREFEAQVQAVLDIENSLLAISLGTLLNASLSAHAFSGQLTADWREANKDKLAIEASERDAALKEAGFGLSRTSHTMAEQIEELLQDRTNGIYAELNREQRILLREIERMFGGVEYGRYFTAEQLALDVKGSLHRHPQRIESHLSLFAVRGLIIPVSRPRTDNTEPAFAACYRLPVTEKLALDADDAESYIFDDLRAKLMDTQRALATGGR